MMESEMALKTILWRLDYVKAMVRTILNHTISLRMICSIVRMHVDSNQGVDEATLTLWVSQNIKNVAWEMP